MRSSVEVETNMWTFFFRFTCVVDSVFLSRMMSLSLCQSCFFYCWSSAFTLHSALTVAALRSLHIHYSRSSCLDVHKSGSKLDPKIPHAAPWGLLVPLVAVSNMSHYNTSRTAGSDTSWCTWRDECIPVKGMCQLIVSVSWDAGRTAVVVTWLVMNMCWQQASSRGSVWSGIYMEILLAWGQSADGDGGVEQGELILDVCVNVTVGWKKGADTKSNDISRLADCMKRLEHGELVKVVWLHV